MSDEFWFDKRAADLAVAFFEKLLVHSKGEWAGLPFKLQDWQREDIIKPLFGWKRADGTRKYRTAYIEVPRKNGKSTLAAGLALYLLFADGEPGAEVYSAAADTDQARIVFDEAQRMVEASPALSEHGTVFRRSIIVKSERSTYRVISADAHTKHGFNAHGIVFDELHAQPNRELWDVLNTSTGARRQPLMIMITTAGVYDPESICWEQHEYARQVLDGVIDDPSYFAYIAAADDTDDWTSPVTWAKANPGLGETIKVDYLEAECRRAVASPAYQNTFRRLHLNQWCVIIGTMIAMANGTYKPVEDLVVGDEIVSFDEVTGALVARRVTAIMDSGTQPVFRITTKRGRTVTTNGEHPFWTRRGRPDNPKYEWVQASQLNVKDRIGVALEWPEICNASGLTPEHALFLGIMIGDGAMTDDSPRITTMDSGILNFCQNIADEFDVNLRPRGDHPAQYRFTRRPRGGRSKNPLKLWLDECGVYGKSTYDKRVPDCVWRGGRQVWAAFLSGYLDTDGCISTTKENTSIVWVSANRELLADCQQLLAMLGAQANLRQGRRTGFLSWRLEVHERRSMAILNSVLTLTHSEKAQKLATAIMEGGRDGAASLDRFRFDPIASIELLEPQPIIGVEIEDTHTHITNGLITHNTAQDERWLDMAAWNVCQQEFPDLRGRTCYGGLDLASTTDIAAFVLCFPPEEEGEPYRLKPFFWIPKDNLIERVRRDRVPYDAWLRDGYIQATPGNVIDYYYIEQTIRQLALDYEINEIAFDRWGATLLYQRMEEAKQTMIQFGQGYASMSPPTKEFLKLILAGQIAHDGNPVLRWMADNVVARQDPAGNVKPDKSKSKNKIDGIVAGIMALDRALRHERSVYDERGILEL